jgi:hypothetical protein
MGKNRKADRVDKQVLWTRAVACLASGHRIRSNELEPMASLSSGAPTDLYGPGTPLLDRCRLTQSMYALAGTGTCTVVHMHILEPLLEGLLLSGVRFLPRQVLNFGPQTGAGL